MKPVDSQGQRGITVVRTMSELNDAIFKARNASKSNKVIAEKFLDGSEVSLHMVYSVGRLQKVYISDRHPDMDNSGAPLRHVYPSIYSGEDLELEIGVLDEILLKEGICEGIVYVQLKRGVSNFKLVELAFRLDGCHMSKVLSYYTGTDLIREQLNTLLKQNIFNVKCALAELPFLIIDFEYQNSGKKFSELSEINSSIPSGLNVLEDVSYYSEGDLIRTINGKKEKTGYIIYG